MGCSAAKPKKQLTYHLQFKHRDSQQPYYEEKKQKKQFLKGVPNLTQISESTIISRRCLQEKNFQPNLIESKQAV